MAGHVHGCAKRTTTRTSVLRLNHHRTDALSKRNQTDWATGVGRIIYFAGAMRHARCARSRHKRVALAVLHSAGETLCAGDDARVVIMFEVVVCMCVVSVESSLPTPRCRVAANFHSIGKFHTCAARELYRCDMCVLCANHKEALFVCDLLASAQCCLCLCLCLFCSIWMGKIARLLRPLAHVFDVHRLCLKRVVV